MSEQRNSKPRIFRVKMEDKYISSLKNPVVKDVVRLRRRNVRDAQSVLLVEGYRELQRALDNGCLPTQMFFCRSLFLGDNEDALIARARAGGSEISECGEPVFRKMAYRDRPDGLLALVPQQRLSLDDLRLGEVPLVLVAESIEKPGNLGTILRSADAAGVDGVIVCDKCTDIFNPNVVRASIGTIFTVPVVEASSAEVIDWLRAKGIRILAATPHAQLNYTDTPMDEPLAIVVGAEQYGLGPQWMAGGELKVRIPMMGQADSLNVASAATILLYEAVRQRMRLDRL
jgi:TrmH family RNA methyltransferase